MVYKATQDVVRRVMPLLDLLATRTVDKARLLQYLSARSGVDWGILELQTAEFEDTDDQILTERTITFRDRTSGAEHRIRYPGCLNPEIEPLVLDEYKRLAAAQPLSMMAIELFDIFFSDSHCRLCRWRGTDHAQFHTECHFAGRPVNFEPEPAKDSPESRPD